jgi:hypothetical protein
VFRYPGCCSTAKGSDIAHAFQKPLSKRHLYLASAPLQTGRGTQDEALRRVPASALEEALVERLRCWSRRSAASLVDLLAYLKKVTVQNEATVVNLAPPPLEEWASNVEPQEHLGRAGLAG